MSSWSDFIASQALSPTAATGPVLAHCDHLAVIRAQGDDAFSYLQGQLTCDMEDLRHGLHRNAMHLSLKGRGLVSLRVCADGDDVLMIVPAAMSEALIKALSKYRLRAKVTFSEESQRVVFGVAAELDTLAIGPVPAPAQTGKQQDNLLLRYPHGEQLLLITDQDQAAGLWQQLAKGRQTGNGQAWCYQDIVAGEGHIYPGGEDLFLPQVLNYDLTAGISFRKGCYTGQEVVARMHFKGKLKQRMQRINYQAEIPLKPGEVLRDNNGKAAGEVVLSAGADKQRSALVVLKRDSDGELYLDGQPLNSQLAPLPYQLVWKD